MTKVQDIMTGDPHYAETSTPVSSAARTMASEGVGALPIRGEDKQLKGMLTDRDIVVKVLAEGKDPMAIRAGEVAQGEVITVRPDDEAGEVLHRMARHRVRRLPVVEGTELVGIVAQADAARALEDEEIGDAVEHISQASWS